jgi:lactoylglutathione lyase
MNYLHTMVRASDLDETLDFYCNKLGLVEVNRYDSEAGRFTLVFLAAPDDAERARGRNFGHLAYRVDNIYALCQQLMDKGVTINRPPRDGHMAFIRSPDGISIELPLGIDGKYRQLVSAPPRREKQYCHTADRGSQSLFGTDSRRRHVAGLPPVPGGNP